ncbi:MAG: hypothetical protein J5685_07920 [Clostridiales bacterium]|nr:hypothetical protein [Clostridiales bacterium]
MAAIAGNWNYTDSMGMSHTVTLEKNKVSIDGSDPVKISKYRSKESNMIVSVYQIPNDQGDDLKLCIKGKEPVLARNGINVATGEKYAPEKMPGWIWVFYILFIAEFFLVMGGALGGVFNGSGAFVCSAVAVNKKMNGVARFFVCLGVFIAFSVLEVILAIAINGALNGMFG